MRDDYFTRLHYQIDKINKIRKLQESPEGRFRNEFFADFFFEIIFR